MQVNFIPIHTRILYPPQDKIWDIIDNLTIVDGDIVFITSKILAIHQGRCVPIDSAEKIDLIRAESDRMAEYKISSDIGVRMTITNNILIPAAGIDESNSDGHYILWPKDIDNLCQEIRSRLMDRTGVKNLGVIATDSYIRPLRWGVNGITIGFSGINPLEDVRGNVDIFGREMSLTQINKIDPLASMAVLIMGETTEQIPIVVLRGWKGIEFDDAKSMDDFLIDPEMDLFGPLLEVLK